MLISRSYIGIAVLMALCNVLNLIPCQIPSNIVTVFPPSITLLKQQGTKHPYLSCQARALRSCCCCASVQSVSDAGIKTGRSSQKTLQRVRGHLNYKLSLLPLGLVDLQHCSTQNWTPCSSYS